MRAEIVSTEHVVVVLLHSGGVVGGSEAARGRSEGGVDEETISRCCKRY